MPYKRRPPVPEAEMERSRYLGHHTICQTLREIYHATDSPEIKLMARQAMAYAKALHEHTKYWRAKATGQSIEEQG